MLMVSLSNELAGEDCVCPRDGGGAAEGDSQSSLQGGGGGLVSRST